MRAQSADPTLLASSRRPGPQSVGRIFSILDAIAGSRTGATLSELAVIAGAPKTSLVGLLAGLTAEGCLFRDASGRYSLGPRVHSLAIQAMVGRELVIVARPILHRLVEATGETAVIGTLAPDADLAVYLDKVESSNPIRYAVTVGERRELHCTAIGKALLAHFDPGRLKKYLRSSVRKRFTANTITGAADLAAEMARIRREGIARTSDERVSGASGLAVPIYGGGGTVVAAFLIAGPSARMRANAKSNERSLRSAAAECARFSGGVPPVQART